MKKMVLILVIVMISTTDKAFQGSQLIQQETRKEYKTMSFLNAADTQNINPHSEDVYNVDEYDQVVCDDVRPPLISPLQASLTNIAARVFVQCLIIKEIASEYLQGLKNFVSQCFATIMMKK